jgi:hypothetical protein
VKKESESKINEQKKQNNMNLSFHIWQNNSNKSISKGYTQP